MEGRRVAWNDAFSVGDAQMDAQHRVFFDEIGAVTEALERGEGKDAVIAFYCAFVGGLARHFADEEALLERLAYPHLEDHRHEHEALMQAVTAVEAMLMTSESIHDLRYVVKRLFTGLVEHLVSEDIRYKSHVLVCMGA